MECPTNRSGGRRRCGGAYDGKHTSPAKLLRDDSVSHDEKVRMLEQWSNDEKDLLRVSEEGMQADDRPDVQGG